MRLFTRLAVGVGAALLLLATTAPPAQADPGIQDLDYVALGDSYTSGTGTREYFDDDCQRSEHAFPAQLAQQRGFTLSFDACAGARVDDVRNNQLANLTPDTNLVTVSAGGNDAGWADVITSCARPWPWTCWTDIDNAEEFIADQLPDLLGVLYRDIREAAPSAQVIVVGYPRLFNGETCNVIARISAEEQERLNAAADLLSETIEDAALAHGFEYLDARGPFTGHAVCDDEEWLNGVSNPIGESYHPNREGHDGYTTELDQLV